MSLIALWPSHYSVKIQKEIGCLRDETCKQKMRIVRCILLHFASLPLTLNFEPYLLLRDRPLIRIFFLSQCRERKLTYLAYIRHYSSGYYFPPLIMCGLDKCSYILHFLKGKGYSWVPLYRFVGCVLKNLFVWGYCTPRLTIGQLIWLDSLKG